MPSLKVSGAQAVVVVLYVTAFFGSAHLLAISKPDNKWARAWLGLGF